VIAFDGTEGFAGSERSGGVLLDSGAFLFYLGHVNLRKKFTLPWKSP
jgi:hypothetical protein